MRTCSASLHEAYVRSRFDALHQRFKNQVRDDDVRLRGLLDALGPVAGRRILDLGCGKGRFARRLHDLGAEVVGLDPSHDMIVCATGFPRARGSGRRTPFPDNLFDAVIAVEVFEHLESPDPVLIELCRVLRAGGTLAIIDKNAGALDARRPWLPSLFLKWIDQRRGRWMYPPDSPVVERWFWPGPLSRRIGRQFENVSVEFLIQPVEAESAIFRHVPRVRLLALWKARKPEARDG